MKAVLLGAGFGKRLQPVTDTIPKIMIPVAGEPLLAHSLRILRRQGVRRVCMNLHYRASQVQDYIKNELKRPSWLSVNYESEILGTGGGLRGLEPYLGDSDFLVYNGDIITTIDLKKVMAFHLEHKPLATMVLHDWPGLNMVYTDAEGAVCDIRNLAGNGHRAARTLAFTGISVISGRIFDHLPKTGFSDIISTYISLLKSGQEKIMGYEVSGHYWRDLGSIRSYWEYHRDLYAGVQTGIPRPDRPVFIHPEATVAPGTALDGFCCVYEDAYVTGGRYRDCILLPGFDGTAEDDLCSTVAGAGFRICADD